MSHLKSPLTSRFFLTSHLSSPPHFSHLSTSSRHLQARAKLDTFYSREAAWAETSGEVEVLRKQVLLPHLFPTPLPLLPLHSSPSTHPLSQVVLQGELVARYRERLEQLPVAGREEEMRIIQVLHYLFILPLLLLPPTSQDAARHEVAAARADLVASQQELTAAAGRAAELEGRLGTVEAAAGAQGEAVAAAQEEMQERLAAAEERGGGGGGAVVTPVPRYSAVRSVNSHLEGHVMELQERLARQARGGRRGRKGASPGGEGVEVGIQGGGRVSAAGSQGSEAGEYLRRALASPPVQLGTEASAGGSLPVGSAHSALHLPGLDRGEASPPQLTTSPLQLTSPNHLTSPPPLHISPHLHPGLSRGGSSNGH